MFWSMEPSCECKNFTMKFLGLILILMSVRQASCQISGCSSTTDIIFVLDSSGSLVENSQRSGNWDAIRTFVSTAITNIGDTIERRNPSASGGIRVALVQFADRAFLTFGLNSYRNYNDAASVVRNVQNFGGSTNMAAGLQIAESLLPPQSSFNSRNTIVVLVSDFRPNIDRNELFIAQRIKNRNDVKIVSVGVQGNVDEVLLRQIASENRVVLSEDYQTLLTHITPLIMVMCESIPSQPASQCARDIVLILDASISITTWNTLKEFAALVAANLANADQNTRIGVVSFSDTSTVIAPVQQFSPYLSSLIVGAAHRQDLTNIADGLRVGNGLFTDPNRQRHVVIFTDGVATRDSGLEASVADSIRRQGVNIIAYGVGTTIDRGTLERLVADNLRLTNVIVNPTYATNMISQINAVTMLAACALNPVPPCIEQQADVVLALDASGSIVDKGSNNWRLMQNFAIELIRQLVDRHPAVRIGALLFSEEATWLSALTTNYFGISQAIQSASHINSFTNQAAAFRMARDIFNMAVPTPGPPRIKIVIMVTDGEPTKEVGLEGSAAQLLQSEGILRILVGVTNQINRNNLYEIASRPDTVVYSESFETLNSVPMITAVVRATANCPGGSSFGGEGPSRDIPTPRCYAADVIFAMDSSGSIEARTPGNFQRMKNLVSDLARSLHQRYSQVRFGLVIFSDQADIISWLERYSNVETFVNIVQSVNYYGSRTNIAAAIRESRRALGAHGTKIPQIILLTDGENTEEPNQEYVEANIARSFGIRVSAIAVTNEIQEEALIRITGSRNQVFRAPNFEGIQNEIVSVTEVACQPQGDTALSCNGLPEIVFLLDASASITDDELRSAKEFIINSIDTFYNGNSNSRFGLVVFSTYARSVFGLQGDLNYIRTMVNSVSNERGRTNIAEGLERASQVLLVARPGGNRIIILITDGLANERIGQEINVAYNIKSTGISIVPVGVTEYGPDYSTLQAISSFPNGNGVVRSLNFAMLNMRIGELTQIACRPNNNVFIPQPPNFPQPRTTYPSLTARTTRPPSYVNSPGLPISCPGTHIVLLIDKSRRMNPTQSDLDQTKRLVADIVRHIASTKPSTRFSLITFDSTGKVEDSFSASRTLAEVLLMISAIQIRNTQDSYYSNIARGLFASRNTIAQSVNTQSVKSYIILFSDGVSNLDSGIEFTEARIVRSMGIEIIAVGIGTPMISLLSGLTGDMSLVFNAPSRRLEAGAIDRFITNCGSKDGQQIAFLRQDNTCPEEVVFVVDSAGNNTMENANRRNVSEFMSSIVEEYARFYDIRGRFAAIQFSDVAEVSLEFSKDLPYVTYTLTHLKQLNYSEEVPSDLAKGLQLAKELFEENSKKKLVIAIVDEVADGDGSSEILEKVSELKDKDISLVIVGISSAPKDDMFFEEIAGSQGGLISVHHYAELENEVNTVINTACNGRVTFRQNHQISLLP